MLSCVQKVFFGRVTKPENKRLADINGRELVAVIPLVLMIFVIGLFPNIFLSQIKGATARIRDEYSNRLELHPPDPAGHYYDGPVKLLARRPDAPRLASAAVPAPAANEETH
jgi:NADH-quinone oxidoreductase subunit M